MGKTIWIVIILLIIIIGGVIAIYFFYEKPKQESQEIHYVNLSIIALEDKQPIVTNYAIVSSDNVEYLGKTNSKSYVQQRVIANRTYNIYNYNSEGQNYYTDNSAKTSRFFNVGDSAQRVDLELISPGKLEVIQRNSLKNNNEVNFTLISNGEVRNLIFCLGYSIKIIPDMNLNRIEVLPRYNTKSVKCYSGDSILENQEKNLTIKYSSLRQLDSSDFINFYVIDGDISYNPRSVVSYGDEKDVWMPDFELKLVFEI